MKISNFYLCFMLLAACSFVSCRLDKPDPLPERYSVRLVLDREGQFDEREEPLTLTKATSDDLYAVQVYTKSGTNYNNYVYGIFDDESKMNLELEFGSTYKIEVSLVPNGKTCIAKEVNGGYQTPFLVGGFSGTPGKVTNEFVSCSVFNYLENNTGKAMICEDGKEYSRPPVGRYYGVVENYRLDGGNKLTIPLKFVCFGLTIDPVDFTEGSIEIKMDGAPTFTLTPDQPNAVTKKIFTFENFMGEDWTADDFSEDIPISIIWTLNNGTKVTFLKTSNKVSITRKMNKILTLQCGNGGQGQIVLEREDDSLVDDNETFERP